MIYLHGINDRPGTWELDDKTDNRNLITSFKTKQDARLWVIKELRRRVAEINKVKHEWMHPNDNQEKANPS